MRASGTSVSPGKVTGATVAAIFALSATWLAILASSNTEIINGLAWPAIALLWLCSVAGWAGVWGWWTGRMGFALLGAWLSIIGNVWLSLLVVAPLGFAIITTIATISMERRAPRRRARSA